MPIVTPSLLLHRMLILPAAMLIALASLLACSQSVMAGLFTVDFSTTHNRRMQEFAASGATSYPEGLVNLGGIPFNIPSGGNNVWHSNNAGGANPRTLSVPVGLYGVSTLYSLINTFWGETSAGTYASINFVGSDGAFFEFTLDGNYDIRDFKYGGWTNAIASPTTRNVVSVGSARLDMLTIDLPIEFALHTLDRIEFEDNGDSIFQRIFVAGITVDYDESYSPSPGVTPIVGTAWLVILGLGGFLYSATKSGSREKGGKGSGKGVGPEKAEKGSDPFSLIDE